MQAPFLRITPDVYRRQPDAIAQTFSIRLSMALSYLHPCSVIAVYWLMIGSVNMCMIEGGVAMSSCIVKGVALPCLEVTSAEKRTTVQ